jgi:hypothetical protein
LRRGANGRLKGLEGLLETAMSDVTYVSFVPKAKRDKLRDTLESEDTGALRWSEKRTFSGSEFYFSGPASLVRRTHSYVAEWLANG